MHRIHIDLTDEQLFRLKRLALKRKRTPEQCIIDFIVTCAPDGTGWTHPAEGTSTISGAELGSRPKEKT